MVSFLTAYFASITQPEGERSISRWIMGQTRLWEITWNLTTRNSSWIWRPRKAPRKQRKAKLLWGWKRMTTRPKFPMFSTEWSRWIHVEQNNQTMTKSFWSSLFLKYNLYNLETSSIFLTFKSLLIFSMDGCIWISGFAVIILKYLLAGCFWIIVEIPGVYTTHYSVRVVFGPSRVRVGQKIPSTSQVSNTRRSLIIRHSHKIAGLNNGVREDKSLLRTNCLTEIATIHVGRKDCVKSLTSENGSNSLQQLNGWEMVQGRGGVQQKNTLRGNTWGKHKR